jgi:predicted DNA-binding transcriptional regulator AlpA
MTQIDRLEGVGKFPKRRPLGDHANSPVGWLKAEIHEWCRKREAKRHGLEPEGLREYRLSMAGRR